MNYCRWQFKLITLYVVAIFFTFCSLCIFILVGTNLHLYSADKDLPPTIVVPVIGAVIGVLFVLNCLLRYSRLNHKSKCKFCTYSKA